ncbi:hypothetical protein [Companilactobacillus nodensis]|uniref:Uncharacterized protein n=1 Tax=Companilactobacillus nodensis DSM 19682 = JCM 14932 = NBRC 107160 TaxID=1423775 RepID=A0A0R1KFE9_9LACO|nr:hypothetical protein [Companilactobacillus nodensis]KRK78634.1 hypothetical protein FD03_GL002410 [Companilactobacillus nodensis DSM 19682 = JCM 14932 = NBRC 107160]
MVIKLFQEFDVKRSILENHIPKSVFEENKLFAGYTFITFDENNNAIIFENTSDGVTQFESVQKKNFFDETNSRYSTIRGFIADNNIKPESVKWQIECIFFKDLDNLNLIKRTDYYAFPEISEIGYRLLWANPDNLVKVNLLISDLKNFEQTQKSPSVKKDVFDVCEYLEELDIGKVTMGHFRKLMKDDFGFRGNSKVMKEFVNYKFKRNRMNPKLPSNYLPFSNHKGGELKQSYGSLYGIHIYRELDGISSSNKEKFYYKYILIADSTENVRLSYNNGHPIRKLISEKENSISESLLIKMFDVDFIRVNQPTVRPYAVKFNKEFSKMNPVTK